MKHICCKCSPWNLNTLFIGINQPFLKASSGLSSLTLFSQESQAVVSDSLFSSLTVGHCEERWDCLSGSTPSPNSHSHGDVWRLPEEDRSHHRRLYPQPSPGGPDRGWGSRGGGPFAHATHDEQVCVVRGNLQCYLRPWRPSYSWGFIAYVCLISTSVESLWRFAEENSL